MKRYLFMIALAAMVAMTGCTKDETITIDGTKVSKNIVKAFQKQFPNAANIKWTKRGGFTIATFSNSGTKAVEITNTNTAWYDDTANCRMTELDYDVEMLKKELPAVWKAFQASKYSACEIDDIDRISREGYTNIYVLEVEDGKSLDMDLYFSEDGILLREVPDKEDDDDDDKYDTLISEIDIERFNAILSQRYGDFQVIEIDVEDDGTFEIEIIAERDNLQMKIEVTLAKDGAFLYDEIEVDFDKAPKVIQEYVNANYPEANVEEFDIFTDADNVVYYVFEYETTDDKETTIALSINSEGKVFVVPSE